MTNRAPRRPQLTVRWNPELLEARRLLSGSQPFGGTPLPIAASGTTTIEAENFDTGGEFNAYHDTDAANLGGAYRPSEGVDIQPTGDTGGGFNVGWVQAGEWLKYTVNVAQAGRYAIGFRVATAAGGGTFHLESDGVDLTGPIRVNNTGGWQNYVTLTKHVNLPAGQHILRLVMDASDDVYLANFNNLAVTPDGAVANSAGVLDPTFGTINGLPGIISGAAPGFTLDATGTGPADLAVMSDGRIVAVGLDKAGNGTLWRYRADSTTDPTFGLNGIAPVVSPFSPTAVAVQPDGKIVVAGIGNVPFPGGTQPLPALEVARYNVDGSLDTTFATGGTFVGDNFNAPGQVLIQPDGKILIGVTVGFELKNLSVWRLNPNGTRDASFGTNGQALASHPGSSEFGGMALRPDGRILVAGSVQTFPPGGPTPFTPMITQLSSSGVIDPVAPFTPPGVSLPAQWNSVAVEPDGSVLAAGMSGNPGSLASRGFLAHYLPDGTLDPSFGVGGWVTAPLFDASRQSSEFDQVFAAPGGKALVVAQQETGDPANQQPRIVAERFTSTGALDGTFGNAGIGATPLEASSPKSGVFTQTGSVVVAGTTADGLARILARYTGDGAPASPFGGGPAVISASGVSVIQAENFDLGGEGSGYHDTTPLNEGGAYRPNEGVDLQGTGDTGGGVNVGWTHAGEWTAYTVNVQQAGDYAVGFRVASAMRGGTFHLEVDGLDVTGPIRVDNTGGWQNYVTLSRTVTLPAGDHVLKLVDELSDDFYFANFNYLTFAPASNLTQITPTGTTTLQAEDFDAGGEGIAYHDTEPANLGGAYRPSEGVDIQQTPAGGFDVGWTAPGEWMKYTVSVQQAGNYNVGFAVATAAGGGTFHLEVDGADVTGPVRVNNTGGWQNYTTLTRQVTLPAGVHVLRLVIDASDDVYLANFDFFAFTKV